MRPCQGRDRGFESRHPRHRTADVYASVVFFSLHAISPLPSLHHYRVQEPQFLSLCQSTPGNEPADPADHDACAFGYGERWGCLAVIPRRAGANPFLHALVRDRARSVDCWQMRRLSQYVGESQSTDGECACVARRDYVMSVSAL